MPPAAALLEDGRPSLVRGFDPLDDAVDHGRSLLPATRRAVTARLEERTPAHA